MYDIPASVKTRCSVASHLDNLLSNFHRCFIYCNAKINHQTAHSDNSNIRQLPYIKCH